MRHTKGPGWDLYETAGEAVLSIDGQGLRPVPLSLAEVIRVGYGTVAIAQDMEARWTGGKAVAE